MSINGKEIVAGVAMIANEKQINKELVFESLENSLAVSLRKDYGKSSLKVKLDRNNGTMKVEQHQVVVADLDYVDDTQVKFSAAKKIDPKLVIGDVLVTELPNKDLSRVNAQVFKQVMKQNFKQAERKGAEDHYKKFVGTIFYATVKKLMKNDALVVINEDVEGILPLNEVNGYQLKPGNKVKVVLERIETGKLHQLVFSRSSEKYLRALLAQEIPTIGDETIQVVSVARIKGRKSKVAVKSSNSRIDPMRECIGPKGTRVKEIINSLNGEQVEFVLYDNDLGQYISNIMSPVEIDKIIIDENDNCVTLLVSDSVFERQGGILKTNEVLAKQLLDMNVVVTTENAYVESENEKTIQIVTLFMDELNVDQELAEILVGEGFDNIEAVAYAPVSEYLSIEGFDEEIAQTLKQAATSVVKKYQNKEFDGMKTVQIGHLIILAKAGINTREDLAELSTDELLDIISIPKAEAEAIILEAREIWFE